MKKTIYTKPFRKHIMGIARELQYFFMFRDYELKVSWRERVTLMNENSSANKDSQVAASAWIDTVYLNLDIAISPIMMEYWDAKSYRTILNCMVHEFSHALTEPLYILACRATAPVQRTELEDTRERQTERIAKIFCEHLPKDVIKAAKLSHAKDAKK